MNRMLLATLLACSLPVAATGKDEPSAYLGVSLAPLNEETRAAHGVPADVTAGALVDEVQLGSAAEKAGFRAGDVVVHFDARAIGSTEDLVEAVRARRAGDTVTFALRRGTGRVEGSLALGARPAEREAPAAPAVPWTVVPVAGPDAEELRVRLEKVHERLAHLHQRLALRRAGMDWRERMAREERAAVDAASAGDAAKAERHRVRLELLRELAEETPPEPVDRLARIEAKLDQLLDRLAKDR